MNLTSVNPFLLKQLLAAACITSAAFAAIATKSATGTDLTVAASWTGGSGPGFPTSADVATWDTNSLGTGLTAGSAANWGSINTWAAVPEVSNPLAGGLPGLEPAAPPPVVNHSLKLMGLLRELGVVGWRTGGPVFPSSGLHLTHHFFPPFPSISYP